MPSSLAEIESNALKLSAEERARLATRLIASLEDRPLTGVPETAMLSEQALAEDWNRAEEDEAWSHLQQAR